MESIAIREPDALMPVMDIATATERYKTIVEYVSKLMKEGTDFGKIPGTTKNTLLKPGAEKLCTLFGLSKRFHLVDHTEDWQTPFFNYLYRCSLYRGDYLVAESDGSCNSHETKYRWRKGERVCPECGKATIIKGKAEYGGGWLCWRKPGKSDGCGTKFSDGDETIESQNVDRVANPDIADQVNTMQKMAQKRAMIAATLLAINASEFFTQDMEDFIDLHVTNNGGEEKAETKTETRTTRKKPVSAARKALVQSVADAFKVLNQTGDDPQWTQKTADAFVAQHFIGVAEVDGLEDGQLSDLLKMLTERLDGLKAQGNVRSNLVASILANFDTEKHLTTYLTDHDLPALDKMSVAELRALDREVGIPF